MDDERAGCMLVLGCSVAWLALLRHVMPDSLVFLFFFFQAEDGIRDVAVTGVQTCALPISNLQHFQARALIGKAALVMRVPEKSNNGIGIEEPFQSLFRREHIFIFVLKEIGRASCRERV